MEKRIKQIRTDNDLTQVEFAQRVGVKRNTIAMYESGREPAQSIIVSICRTFRVRESWLRTGEGDMYEQDAHTILDQLADEYGLGPAGRMIVQAALKMYDIGGEEAFVRMVQELLPMMQEIASRAETQKFVSAYVQSSDAASERSESK